MRILHDGPSSSQEQVNGVNQAAWALAIAQAALGHEVVFRIDAPTYEQKEAAHGKGIRFEPSPQVIERVKPDVIHFHSVFIPRQARLAFAARRTQTPHIVQPHGGVAPQVFARGRTRKLTYSAFVERPRFRAANLFIASLPPEIEEIRTFVGGRRSDIWVVPNPIPAPPSVSSLMPMLTEDAVFLGRFDVLHKGIDRLIALAELMPDITFGLYGSGDRTEMPGLPDNVRVHEPVFGIDKWRLLASARMYVQLSRWESFGMSIFEAMMVGTPPVVADSMHAAKTVCDLGGLSIDTRNLTTEAGHVRRLLDQATTDLSHNELMASRAKSFVDPISVARQVCTAYEHALKA